MPSARTSCLAGSYAKRSAVDGGGGYGSLRSRFHGDANRSRRRAISLSASPIAMDVRRPTARARCNRRNGSRHSRRSPAARPRESPLARDAVRNSKYRNSGDVGPTSFGNRAGTTSARSSARDHTIVNALHRVNHRAKRRRKQRVKGANPAASRNRRRSPSTLRRPVRSMSRLWLASNERRRAVLTS